MNLPRTRFSHAGVFTGDHLLQTPGGFPLPLVGFPFQPKQKGRHLPLLVLRQLNKPLFQADERRFRHFSQPIQPPSQVTERRAEEAVPDRAYSASALPNRLCVIRWMRSSGPCGRLQWDHGSICPGGEERPCAHQMVEALKTKFPFGPG
jgi:hypothetical protein